MEKEEELKIIEIDRTKWIIPQCCRENWESCKHVAQKQKKQKVNIGL